VSKIIPALQSRCTRFRFGPLLDEAIKDKLDEVIQAEGLTLDKPAIDAIVQLSGGDMRKVLNILESCSLAYKHIPTSKIFEVTGRPSPEDIESIYGALTCETFANAFEIFWGLRTSKSLSLDDIVRELHT
jgi:replication factor C subunit 3/5